MREKLEAVGIVVALLVMLLTVPLAFVAGLNAPRNAKDRENHYPGHPDPHLLPKALGLGCFFGVMLCLVAHWTYRLCLVL
jgi:hypothetical protein